MASRFLRRRLAGLAAAACALAAPAGAQPLDAAQRAAVLEAAGLKPRDGGTYAIDGCASVLKPQLESIELEAGRTAGVLVYLAASRCFAETQGGNVALLVADANGRWSMPLAFVPGVEVVRQPRSNAGWPDLGVANPGGCMPVYRHDGVRYARIGQKALQPGGCQFRE